MNIKNLISQFNSLNKNNDLIISADEIKNSSIKKSIWKDIIHSDMCIEEFVVKGLTIEYSKNDKKEESTGFDKLNAEFLKQGIKPVCYDKENNIIVFDNGVRLTAKDIKSYEELSNAPTDGVKSAKGTDISKLKLTDEQLLNLVIDDYTTLSDEQRTVFEKYKSNMNSMGLGIESLHEQNYKGYGSAALLDQKYCENQIFKDKVVNRAEIGTNKGSLESSSWHTASMLSIMNKTAPNSDLHHYHVTDMDTKTQDAQFAEAIKDILDKNKNLPDDKKIRTIVMGWGFYKDNPKYDEYIELCKKAVDEGVFICSNNTEELYGISLIGTNRNPKGDVNTPESYTLPTWYNADEYKDVKKEYLDTQLYFPMQHLTIAHSDGKSIQYEGDDGGQCWANAVGTLYNDFLSIKPDLKPKEFIKLLMENSDELNVKGIYCGKLLNAKAAAEKLKSNNIF